MIVHCTECHHEWQTWKDTQEIKGYPEFCDWCDAPGYPMVSEEVDHDTD